MQPATGQTIWKWQHLLLCFPPSAWQEWATEHVLPSSITSHSSYGMQIHVQPVGMPVEYKIERLSTFLAWLWFFHGRQVCMGTLRTLMERPEWGVRIRDPEPNMVWICCMLPDMSIFLVRDL